MNIQQAVHEALKYWSSYHADSTVKCQQIYFRHLLQLADELKIKFPCQELYTDFIQGASTPNVKYSRIQVIKAVDFISETHAFTPEGNFYNEPFFPTIKETKDKISSLSFPITETIDISFLISYGAIEVERLGICKKGIKQYWHSWRDIRTYLFLQNGSMNYNYKTLKQYLTELDIKFDNNINPPSSYYIHRKAALIIIEVAKTGKFECKRILRNPIQPFKDSKLEIIRQQYLSFLRENNFAESTIRTKDYVLRSMIKFSEIQSVNDLFYFSSKNVNDILKGFASNYKDISSLIPIIRSILKYLYEKRLMEVNRAEMVMSPFCHHDVLPSFIPVKDDNKFYESLKKDTKRNIAIILLARKLGLRSGDICNLTFSQIDWSEEKIRLTQRKTGEPLVLPLLPEVGNAIFDYICDERPKRGDDYPYVFLRSKAPFTKITRLYAISDNLIKRSGVERVNGTHRGMHLYRRTLTHRLLIDEVPHQVITDTLGHCSKESDKPYIPIEEHRLRQCGLGLDAIGIKSWEGCEKNE